MGTQQIQSSKISNEIIITEQDQSEEQKLRSISLMVKEWKNGDDNEIYCKVSWMQIRKHSNFLMEYLSREKISDRALFYQSLASLDSLLSIFKFNLFMELNFTKTFYRNIQREFEDLCLEYNFGSGQKQQKQQEFQMYSILFLLVMLIYFSGRPESSHFKSLPLQIVNKTFMNSLISLQLNITQKNERIIGLILAYLVKNMNLKIYGQKMLKFLLNHFDKIHMPRTVYHFVYCMRAIHLEREIDIKLLRKYRLIEKLWIFWGQTFESRESIYLVDYINLVLSKYEGLASTIDNLEPLVSKIQQFHIVNQFSLVHQELILQIVTKIHSFLSQKTRQTILSTSFSACPRMDSALKLLCCILSLQPLYTILQHIFPFVDSFISICSHRQLKSILFSLQIISELLKKCVDNKLWGLLDALREKIFPILEDLKEYHVYRRDIAKIEAWFKENISIECQTLA